MLQIAEEAPGALQMQDAGHELEVSLRSRTARVGVIGLGYVGLPLAVEMARAGYTVTGIDSDQKRVESLNSGDSYILDVPEKILRSLLSKGKLQATASIQTVRDLDAVSICVPTPLRKTKDPDLSYVISAVESARDHLRPRQLIILESTTYPGTTREVVLPILEQTGLRIGQDFFLAYSPERVDPGNRHFTTVNIPKIVGGMTPRCTELATLFYQQIIHTVIPVSSPECAEMVKLAENTFRCVNIALANEMAMMCHKLGTSVWEVIEAAKTKPFGFMPFYPGPGLGGHCIPVDPYYLTWKARLNGSEPRLVELAANINSKMPDFTVGRVADALNERSKSLKSSKILGLGVAYKRDAMDVRESPAIEVIRNLHEKGAEVCYADPYVPSIDLGGRILNSVECQEALLRTMDCVVVLTDHSAFDYAMIAAASPLVVDTRNALKEFREPHVVRL